MSTISGMELAGDLTGDEWVEIVQDGKNRKVPSSALFGFGTVWHVYDNEPLDEGRNGDYALSRSTRRFYYRDSGIWIDRGELFNAFTDAPKDNRLYLRINGMWKALELTPSDRVPSQSDSSTVMTPSATYVLLADIKITLDENSSTWSIDPGEII